MLSLAQITIGSSSTANSKCINEVHTFGYLAVKSPDSVPPFFRLTVLECLLLQFLLLFDPKTPPQLQLQTLSREDSEGGSHSATISPRQRNNLRVESIFDDPSRSSSPVVDAGGMTARSPRSGRGRRAQGSGLVRR